MRNTPPAAAMSPALHLRQPELRAFLCDHQIACEREFGAAAERGAVDRRDGRLVDVVVDIARETPIAVFGVEEVLAAGYRLEIGSGAEGFTGTGDDDGADVRIVLRVGQRIADRGAQCAVDGVARLGAVQRDDHDVAPPLGESGGCNAFCHSSSMMVALAWPPPSHMVCSPY